MAITMKKDMSFKDATTIEEYKDVVGTYPTILAIVDEAETGEILCRTYNPLIRTVVTTHKRREEILTFKHRQNG
jgi:hypothetical protein